MESVLLGMTSRTILVSSRNVISLACPAVPAIQLFALFASHLRSTRPPTMGHASAAIPPTASTVPSTILLSASAVRVASCSPMALAHPPATNLNAPLAPTHQTASLASLATRFPVGSASAVRLAVLPVVQVTPLLAIPV